MSPKAPKSSTGDWEVRRKIKVPTLVNNTDAVTVEDAVVGISGVYEVVIDLNKQLVVLRYDASRVSYHVILETLDREGFSPIHNWWSRIKSGWYQFTDANARENAKAPPPSCCNKPPK